MSHLHLPDTVPASVSVASPPGAGPPDGPGPDDPSGPGQTASGPPAAPGAGPGDRDETDVIDAAVSEVVRRLAKITYSKTVGLGLILALAALVLIGALVQQAPPGTAGDPAAWQDFLAAMRGRFGGWTPLLDFLGLFGVFTSPLFLAVVSGLAVSLVGCTAHRLPRLWRDYRRPRVNVSARFFDVARYRAEVVTGLPDDQALRTAADRLARRRYRVRAGGPATLYADRFAWGGFGTVAAHLGFLVILAAFVVSAWAGSERILILPVGGDAVDAGGDSGLTVEATSFSATADPSGRPTDYVSHLVVRRAADEVAERDVRVNSPLTVGRWRFHQTSYGVAVQVVASSVAGAVEFAGAVAMDRTSGDGRFSVGEFRLPARGISVDVLTAASGAVSGLDPGSAAFAVYRDGESEPMALKVAQQGGAVTVGDLELAFLRESPYTGVTVRSDPGAAGMWLGSALLVVGMTVTFVCRRRRVWLRAEEGRLRLAGADREDPGLRRAFEDLAAAAAQWFDRREDNS